MGTLRRTHTRRVAADAGKEEVVVDEGRDPGRPERVALITGGGGGLGGAVARLLAEAGAFRLALVDNRADALDAVVNDVGGSVDVDRLVADLSVASEVESVVPWAIGRFGRVDALVNTAAILHRQAFDDVTPADFDSVYRTNAFAPFLLARAAMPDMASRGWGRIVNVTSTGVYEGGFTMTSALYEGSKGSVAVLTKMLSRHGAPNGILVNSVCPGGMRTRMLLDETSPELVAKAEREMIPLGRLADPVEVAQVIVWLVSDLGSYATGAEFDITGGLALH
jgi:NAD(P)-dependent dehydrogenase (short-subunit alcohol dehydrogenase family)